MYIISKQIAEATDKHDVTKLGKIKCWTFFQVFAGCLDTASEGAQRLRVEVTLSLDSV